MKRAVFLLAIVYWVAYAQWDVRHPAQKSGVILGEITIASIKFVEVVREGIDESVIDMRGVAHWAGSAEPGKPGNVVLAVHRVIKNTPFFRAERIKIGDRIIIRIGNSDQVAQYDIYEMFVVDPVKGYSIIYPPADPRDAILTIFTCDPPFSDAMRLIIRARLVRHNR